MILPLCRPMQRFGTSLHNVTKYVNRSSNAPAAVTRHRIKSTVCDSISFSLAGKCFYAAVGALAQHTTFSLSVLLVHFNGNSHIQT